MTTFELRHDDTATIWLRWESIVGVAVLGAMGMVIVTGQPGTVGADMQEAVWSAFRFMFTSPLSLVLIASIFALEWFLPAQPEQRALTLYGLGVTWFIRFTHSNVRTNLGPLRYVLVTPQSHRIHHSSDPEHWNSNYANIFCWDRLFGMQHPDDQTYPTTGINDLDFPEPATFAPAELVRCFVRQMTFPFDTDAVRRATHGSPHDHTGRSIDDSPG